MAKYRVPALEKSIAILNLIASGKRKYTITEITKELEISKATVFSILNVLNSHDILRRNSKGEYEIGLKLYELGMSYASDMNIVEIAHPYLENLMEETGHTVHLGVLDEGEILYIDKVEPDSFIKFSTYPGLRAEFHTTSLGKSIVAYLKDVEVEELVATKGLSKFTSKTITNLGDLKKDLMEIRHKGYALEDEEGEIGVRCIGAPIFNGSTNHIIASISIAGHTSKLTYPSIEKLSSKVQETANVISKKLGFTGVVNSVK